MAKRKSKGKRPLGRFSRNKVVPATANVSDMRRRPADNEVGTMITALKIKIKLVQNIVRGILAEPAKTIQPRLPTIPESGSELADSDENRGEEAVVEKRGVGAPSERFFNLLMLADVAEAEHLQRKRARCSS